jgi:hypothetical protein
MKKNSNETHDDLRPEYDFAEMKIVAGTGSEANRGQ